MEEERLQNIKNRSTWRVKTLKHGWLYGSLCPWRKGVDFMLDVETPYSVREDEFNTLGQYTGYKDIYEGDIVKTPYLDPVFKLPMGSDYVYAVIEFRYGTFVATYDEGTHIYLDDLAEKIEVVGNIYDNPELLEKIERGDLIK